MNEVDVVLGFDMETDVGSFTTEYEGLVAGSSVILDILGRRGLTGTFYFTGDAARKHPEVIRRVQDAGHEIGCHSVYHETVGDPLFHIAGITPLLPEEVEHRLAVATDWVAQAAGERPVSFRAPRLFGSTNMILALENLGYATDASYPMYFYESPIRPYHPSHDDWTKEGGLRILELPNFADLSMNSTDELHRDRDQWPLFRLESADSLMKHIHGFMDYCRDRDTDPFLCFYFHPWEFHPMPQSDIRFGEGWIRPDPFLVKNCGPYAAQQFDRLLDLLLAQGARFRQARQMIKEVY
jgi:peptidoglycan-N-acetylglucosamine deacetylase